MARSILKIVLIDREGEPVDIDISIASNVQPFSPSSASNLKCQKAISQAVHSHVKWFRSLLCSMMVYLVIMEWATFTGRVPCEQL